MNYRRLKQVCQYGLKDAAVICQEDGVNKGRLSVFCDMLHCYFKYNVWTNQYKKEKLYKLTGEARKEICLKYQEENTKRDQWVKSFFDTYKFIAKWSDFKYELSASFQEKRNNAYQKHYYLDNKVFFEHGVIMQKHHYVDSGILMGKKCQILANVEIDYTGGLTLGDKVVISEGTKILTHNHEIDFSSDDLSKGCILTPLMIEDKVWIGTRSTILPGVNSIGRYASVGACSVVRHPVPPYAIVVGNPAKIVGFLYTPEEVAEFEKDKYSETEKTDIEKYKKLYEKYFINRMSEIKKSLSN